MSAETTITDDQLRDSYSGVGMCPLGQFISGLTRDAAPACMVPSLNPGSVSVLTDGTLVGNGTTASPLGLFTPVQTIKGGTGLTNPMTHTVMISEGFAPFNSLPMPQDSFLQGNTSGIATDPTVTTNPTLGGHLQIRNNPPAITECGSGPTVIGNDSFFTVSIGSGSPVTSCIATFVNDFIGQPECSATVAVNPTVYPALTPVMAIPDPAGEYVKIYPQTAGADIGCETVTVICADVVQ